MLRKYHQKKEESNTKIKCLMNKLNEELNTVLMQETKLGDITYDSLLKLIEEAFARMQEMQLK